MNIQEPKGPRAAFRRLIDHLNRHPADIDYFAAGILVMLMSLLLTYGIAWQNGYHAGQHPISIEMPSNFLPPTLEDARRMRNGDHK